MTDGIRTTTGQSNRNLAEVAVWYSIAVIASLFVMLFVFATLSEFSDLPPTIWLPIGALVWLVAFVGVTWRVARSTTAQHATVTLTPVYALQIFLMLSTVARLPFEKPSERGMVSGMLLVWETWIVIFSVAFLLLAVCGRRRVPARTWLTTAASAIVVAGSIYQRL